MTKDGIREKVSSSLHKHWDHVLNEPIPHSFLRLLERMK